MCYNEHMKTCTTFKEKLKNFFFQRKLDWYGLQFPLYCKAHGVKRAERQGAIAQSRTGDKLQIVHVPKKDFPFNVYVYSISLNRVLGYLDNTLSKKLVRVFGKKFCRDAVVENITGGAPMYEFMGCNLQILSTMEFMKEWEDFSLLHEE